MKVTTESSRGYTLELKDAATNSIGGRQRMGVVWAVFCAMQYINGSRYLSGDENSMENRKLMWQKASVQLRAEAVKSK